jgi:zinc/manganese transport system substrate-binding protein
MIINQFIKFIFIFLFVCQANAVEKDVHKVYKIVVTFSILKDLAQNIIGDSLKDKITLYTIVPLMNDPHIYQLKPQDVIILQSADFIIMNGIGFEEWLERIITQPRYRNKFIKIGDLLPFRKNDTVNVYDPHLWHDVLNTVEYVKHIEKTLSGLLPQYKHIFQKNAKTYRKKLMALHNNILLAFSHLPQQKKIIITTHDAFWYFGKRYGLTFLSPIGLSTEEEPSPQKICMIIDYIRQHNIKAIFIENLSNNKQIDKILKETQSCLGGMLYADSLSDSTGPANNYIDMMTYNTQTICAAIQ